MALLKSRQITTELADAVLAMKAGDDTAFTNAMRRYLDVTQDAGDFIERLGRESVGK